jgi:hypothetical protein
VFVGQRIIKTSAFSDSFSAQAKKYPAISLYKNTIFVIQTINGTKVHF